MRTTLLSHNNIHHHGDLMRNAMRARYEVFVRGRGWPMPSEEGLEFDQYDTPQSRWAVVHEEGSDAPLAGFRLTRTTARCGVYSYMIRDAQRGLLASIPETVLYGLAPQDAAVWECSRAFVVDSLPAPERAVARRRMIESFLPCVREAGGSALITLTNRLWRRWMPAHGIAGEAAGPEVLIDGERFQAVMMRPSGA